MFKQEMRDVAAEQTPMTPYYEHAGITIYHGDCRDVMGEWDGLRMQSFDLLLTDPPYGIYACGGKWGRKSQLTWDVDAVPMELIATACALARYQIIWGGNYYSLPPSRGWLVWYKRDSVPSAADVELAWTRYKRATARPHDRGDES
jgi:hypothetical protein